MRQIKNFFPSLIYKKYDKFAETLGYKDWKSAEENPFFIHHLEGDIGWSTTELPSGQWAIWKDEGQLPYPKPIFFSSIFNLASNNFFVLDDLKPFMTGVIPFSSKSLMFFIR